MHCQHYSNTKRPRWAQRCAQSLSPGAHQLSKPRATETCCGQHSVPASPGLSPGLGSSAGAWALPFGAFWAPRGHTGLRVSFSPSKCLSSCQLLYHFWWRFVVRVEVKRASLGEENAIPPHDKSPCETGFLLRKETVPRFSCRLVMILQTLTRGGGRTGREL